MVRILILIGVLLSPLLFSQTFQNIRKRVDEDKIIIIYDLVSIDIGSRVKVSVFSSHDNFETPLNNVSGDVGFVMPGPNRRITWLAGDLIKSADTLTFQFKGEVVYGLKFTNPSENQNFKRGITHTLSWEGGILKDTITLILQTPNGEDQQLIQTDSKNSFDWDIPKDAKTGRGYTLKMTNNETVIEHRFAIKRRLSLAWYSLPVVGVLTYLIIGNGSESNDLPDAPSPN